MQTAKGARDEEDVLQDPQRFSKIATLLLRRGMTPDEMNGALKRAGCVSKGDCRRDGTRGTIRSDV
jgi:hypothetical protein